MLMLFSNCQMMFLEEAVNHLCLSSSDGTGAMEKEQRYKFSISLPVIPRGRLTTFSAKTEQKKTKILFQYSKFDLNVTEKHQITK